MARGSLSERDELGIVEWYERGESTRRVGRRFGVSKTTVRKVLKRMGVQARGKDEPWKLMKAEQDEVIRRYLNGEGSTTIARDYPINSSTICSLMKREGFLRTVSEDERLHREQESVERYLNGERVRAIAKDLLVSRKAVERYIRKAGIPFRRKRLAEAQREEIVRRYLIGETTESIANCMSVSRSAILRTLRLKNIPIRGGAVDFSEAEKEEIARLYRSGKSTNYLGKRLYVSGASIAKVLKEMGTPLRNQSDASRKYSLDEDFFERIDCQEKAYWLGFLMADGTVTERNEVVLKLAKKDEGHLAKYRDCLGSDHPVKESSTFLRSTGRTYEMVRITLISSKLVNDLGRQRITPNKTLKESFPDIDLDLTSHFVRGVFDGDGSIGNSCKKPIFNMVGNKEFLLDIQEHLRSVGLSKTKLTPCGKVHYLVYGGFGNTRRIYNYLYSDASIYLDRKKEKFEEILFGDKLINKSDSESGGIVPLDQF